VQNDVSIEELAQRLETLGFVVAPHGDHIGLRLSLMTSVRVHIRDAVRYTLTEACITQVRHAYGALIDRAPGMAPVERSPDALGAGEPAFVASGARAHAKVT
jgi:hypothetical protein